jgi:DNA-damage-inducible protein D
MDRTELAANQFRMTQTREKLKRENIKNQRDAIEAHETVGKEVRAAIAKIGGTQPENIPPAEHIKQVKQRVKTSKPLLTLDPKDANGLISLDQTKTIE